MPLLAVLGLLAASPPIAPLVEGYPTAKGNASVSFQVGEQPTVGFSYFTANNVAVRIDAGLNAVLSGTGTSTFSFDLGMRFYNWKHDRVGIFLQPSVGVSRIAVAGGGSESLRFSAGVGVEYFFTDHLSAGGILALTLALNNLGGTGPTVTTFGTGPFGNGNAGTSGLFLNVYF